MAAGASDGPQAPQWPAVSRALKLAIAAVAVGVVAVIGVVVWYFFVRDDAPPPLELSDPDADPTEPAAGAGDTTSPDGTWTVSTDLQSGGGQSVVGYRVDEKLASLPARSDAVGRTDAVAGELVVDGATIPTVEVTADLTELESDQGRRDDALRTRGLETEDFPEANFVLRSPIDLGGVPAVGAGVEVTATGDLTVHGVTDSVEVPLEARWSGAVIEVVGSLPVVMADYDIEPPDVAGLVDVDDEGTMEFQLFFVRP